MAMIVRNRTRGAGGTTLIAKVNAELLRSRISARIRCGWLGFGNAFHDRGRIVVCAHFGTLGLDRREAARASLLGVRAAFLLPLKHTAPRKPAHDIQRAGEDKNEEQGCGKAHNPRVCLPAPDWRKGRLTPRRWKAPDGAFCMAHVAEGRGGSHNPASNCVLGRAQMAPLGPFAFANTARRTRPMCSRNV